MSAHMNEPRPSPAQSHEPVAFESLCAHLSQAGRQYLEGISNLINQVAPVPGRVVYLHTTDLRMRMSGLQPVVFSAIDATTQLQVAQANFTATSGAALSFVEFVMNSFPFPVVEIKTLRAAPFLNTETDRKHRDFPILMGERGYLHSFIDSSRNDALYSIASKMTFGEFTNGVAFPASPDELHRVLAQFLYFHNNFRFVPWLDGKTPIQKLRTFARYQGLHSFDPLDESVRGQELDCASPLASKNFPLESPILLQKHHERPIIQGKGYESNPRH